MKIGQSCSLESIDKHILSYLGWAQKYVKLLMPFFLFIFFIFLVKEVEYLLSVNENNKKKKKNSRKW